mmetsp:Transcript_33032/g.50614  ORF Transcript_33032/g.50614 Transcript_33032/m.50614 type:complete len:116 (-) Transcript_33032:2366-2713(-)
MRERMYNVVKYMKIPNSRHQSDYMLKKNDVIKMGRVKLRVKEIFIAGKARYRNRKKERRKKRLQKDDNIIKLHDLPRPSKYPEDYDKFSDDSDESNYEPFVGERNYVDAHIPYKQ